jgi:hypothetical protein
MRLLAQFVAVLLLVGFVGAYFWWIVAAAAVAGLACTARSDFGPHQAPPPLIGDYRGEVAVAIRDRRDEVPFRLGGLGRATITAGSSR